MMAENLKDKKDKRPILCGTDFSATAVEAVDIAAAMARRLGTKLILVNVNDLGSLIADPVLFEGATLQKRRELKHEAMRLAGLEIEVEVNGPFSILHHE
jgi:nucleotide-binding universal stress UspA family protein